MSDREEIAILLKRRFKLNDIQVTNVIEFAYSLSEARSKPNDFAIAHYLNNLAIGLFEMLAENRSTLDITAINRSYILITNELKNIYSRNPELENIKQTICWNSFDRLEYIHDDLGEYSYFNDNDYGYAHNAQVNRLCIINGKEEPDFSPELKRIVDDTEANGKAFYSEVESNKPASTDGSFVPSYTLTYDDNGVIMINGVLRLKKTQAGQASDMIMSQSFEHDGQKEPFKPNIATKRQLTTIIGDMGFDKVLRSLFFPVISKNKGIAFRSTVTRLNADVLHIDTAQLDKRLIDLGAATQKRPSALEISEIPF